MSDQPTTLGSDVIRILESAWADARVHNPDMAEHVVFRTGSGRAKGSLTWGSITVKPIWQGEDGQFHELFISAECLAAGPEQVLNTIIHEGVHSTAFTREIKDCSRQNRYHNGRFRKLAEEAGLAWTHLQPAWAGTGAQRHVLPKNQGPVLNEDGTSFAGWYTMVEAGPDAVIGYSAMSTTDTTLSVYADTLANLAKLPVTYAPRMAPVPTVAKREAVLLVESYSNAGLVTEAEWEDYIDSELVPTEDVQTLGPVVYRGLAGRGLLANHIATRVLI